MTKARAIPILMRAGNSLPPKKGVKKRAKASREKIKKHNARVVMISDLADKLSIRGCTK